MISRLIFQIIHSYVLLVTNVNKAINLEFQTDFTELSNSFP